jgi:hypothetical protein
LVWPEEIDDFLATAGLRLERMTGNGELELEESWSFYVVAVSR